MTKPDLEYESIDKNLLELHKQIRKLVKWNTPNMKIEKGTLSSFVFRTLTAS